VAEGRRSIEAFEAALARTSRARHPYEHATLAYRLGLAYAESPAGVPAENLRRALACYEVAAGIFDARFDPVEHARVLNAAGAAHRALGDSRRSAGLFEEAVRLLAGRGRDDEQAAALNNLGLARTELGQVAPAHEAFDAALALFDTGSAEGRRGRAATLLNRGLASAAAGDAQSLEAALVDYRRARADLDAEEAPYHWGFLHHSLGVTLFGLAQLGAGAPAHLAEAGQALAESLTVFARAAFPFQYALAKHNLGHVQEAAGDVPGLRRALASFEDALGALDPRLQEAAWRQAYASLERVEGKLEQLYPDMSRPAHFAALLAALAPAERDALLRERLMLLLALPGSRRHAGLVEAARAMAMLDQEEARALIEAELAMLMELPNEYLEAALDARMEAHRRLDGEARDEADRALDQAVSDALGGPQRVLVRDYLYSLGFERP
jgi:tetratricopeptide (TPR) repeat protein